MISSKLLKGVAEDEEEGKMSGGVVKGEEVVVGVMKTSEEEFDVKEEEASLPGMMMGGVMKTPEEESGTICVFLSPLQPFKV